MSLRFILYLFILNTCCGDPIPSTDLEIDQDLQPHYLSFVRDAQARGIPVTPSKLNQLVYKNPGEGRIGVCWTKRSYGVLIEAKIHILPGLPYVVEKAVVYHELAHCLFGMEHGRGLMEAGLHMNPMYYDGNWGRLVDELFQNIKETSEEGDLL